MTAALTLLAITAYFAASLFIGLIAASCFPSSFHRSGKTVRRRRIVRCR
ncbi:MAG: hypothetical protein JZU55_00870 [Afipia sp.]|nr:hypothetical protein [Afipia sp.]